MKRTTWLGGIIRLDSHGNPRYYIWKTIAGVRHRIGLGVHTEQAALAEYAAFEKDPAGYIASRAAGPIAALLLDASTVEPFLQWSLNEKKNSKKWVGTQRYYLAWWAGELKGEDLRALKLRRLHECLEGQPAKHLRIAIIKTLYGWLRERDKIETAQDPTYGKLKVPQVRPEQWRKPKAFRKFDYELVSAELKPGQWKDALTVLAGTGWHFAELRRFVQTGEAVKAVGIGDAHGVLVNPQTKGGEPLRTAVDREVFQAATRIIGTCALEESLFYKVLRRANFRAAKKAKAKGAQLIRVLPGRFRHSVATWAVDKGAAIQSVASFLGHKSARTTKKFYATHATPAKVPTLA